MTYGELIDATDVWMETALDLNAADLRRIWAPPDLKTDLRLVRNHMARQMARRPAVCKPYSAGAVGAMRYHRETALGAPQFRFGDLAVTDASTDDQAHMMTIALGQPTPRRRRQRPVSSAAPDG